MQTFDTSCFGIGKVLILLIIQWSLTTKVDYCSSNLVWSPLHQDPSAPPCIFLLSTFFLGNGMGSYGGKREKWGILRQFSQQGCKCLGQGGDAKRAEFHCSYAYLRNETPTPPFIWQKDGYSVGWRAIGGGLVGKLPNSPLIWTNSLQLFQVYVGCSGATCICTWAVVVQHTYVRKQ